jgi:hypothetical protein
MPPSIHYPDMAGFAELKLMECWRWPAFDVRGLDDWSPPLLDLGFVMREQHLGRSPVACGIF